MAVEQMTTERYSDRRTCSIPTNGMVRSMLPAWISSNTMALLAMLWTLRLRPGSRQKKDSSNCSRVVTITGASQFSKVCLISSCRLEDSLCNADVLLGVFASIWRYERKDLTRSLGS